jgi:hypothetical protein
VRLRPGAHRERQRRTDHDRGGHAGRRGQRTAARLPLVPAGRAEPRHGEGRRRPHRRLPRRVADPAAVRGLGRGDGHRRSRRRRVVGPGGASRAGRHIGTLLPGGQRELQPRLAGLPERQAADRGTPGRLAAGVGGARGDRRRDHTLRARLRLPCGAARRPRPGVPGGRGGVHSREEAGAASGGDGARGDPRVLDLAARPARGTVDRRFRRGGDRRRGAGPVGLAGGRGTGQALPRPAARPRGRGSRALVARGPARPGRSGARGEPAVRPGGGALGGALGVVPQVLCLVALGRLAASIPVPRPVTSPALPALARSPEPERTGS